MSDNGPQFTAEEFKTFMKSNGVKHIRCAPYHPSSNGAAERFIQTFKRSMKASQKDGRTFSHRLADFLLTYRAIPHATTGRAPSTLFLQRHLRAGASGPAGPVLAGPILREKVGVFISRLHVGVAARLIVTQLCTNCKGTPGEP